MTRNVIIATIILIVGLVVANVFVNGVFNDIETVEFVTNIATTVYA